MIPLERFVTVAGRTLFVLEAGSGQPTGIFESGLGDSSRAWHRIQAKVAESARTISYDRAGRGQSHFASEGRTLNDCLDDLLTMLAAVKARSPYVLVGHSFGGFIVRLFAHRYPDEVGGIVLVDSAQEDVIFEFQRILKSRVLPPRRFDEPELLTWRRFDQAQHSDPKFPTNILNDEGIDLTTCYKQVREASSLGDLPLTLVSSTKRDDDRKNGAEGAIADWEIAAEKAWNQCQVKLLELSTNATHVLAHESGHYVQDDQPDLVMAAVTQMVERVRSEHQL